ncbi:hypothetical protein DIPPA_34019 [Diplonema papillatum]|nr:hypothetical protein DIPPA_34019 [Diplonema papillatum]
MKGIRPQLPRTRATRFFEDATKEAARISTTTGIKRRANRFLAKKCAGRVADLEAELHRLCLFPREVVNLLHKCAGLREVIFIGIEWQSVQENEFFV